MSREMKDSGIDWIREIPSNWYTQRFKFFRTCANVGISLDKNYWSDDDSYNVFYTAGEKHIYSSFSDFPLDKYTTEQDLLLSRNGTPYVYYPKVHSQYSDHIIRTNIYSKYCKRFVFYCLQQSILSDTVDSVSIPTWSISIWDKQILVVPPLDEQKSIATFLDSKCASINQAIQKQKDIVIKLKEYKQSIITKAVTKGLNPNVKMKDNEIDWIREIPESWDIIPLKVLFKENKRRNKDLTNSNLLSLSYGRIIQKDIDSNFGLLPDNFSKYTIVNDGDIVLRLTDLQNDHKSLRTGLVTQSGIITSAYVTLTPKKKLCSRYFHYLLHSYDIQKIFYTMGEGIRQNLSYDELSRNIRLIMPSFKEQQSIANYLDSKCLAIDESIKRSNKIIQKLEEYKKSLVYNAVTGKIDCRGEVK